MSGFRQDLRWALRCLVRTPTYAVVTIVTLALGIGATTAIYTVVQGVLLQPLPYPEPERIVIVQEKNPEAGFPRFAISPLNFRDYRELSESFEALAASTGTGLAVAGGNDTRVLRLAGRRVTHDYLKVFGIAPSIGRDFTANDDRPDAPRVVILGHAAWQTLGGDAAIVGQDLRIDGMPTRVVGVLPAGVAPNLEALVPLGLDYENSGRGAHWLIAAGRLGPGVSIGQARADLERVAANLATTYPNSNTGWTSVVDPLHDRLVDNVRPALWVLFAAVGLVLLIACANVANLTLARHVSRRREVALRSSLGAGRWRLMRQMLTESALVAFVAGVLGVILAERGTAWLVATNADDLPRATDIAVDGGVLAFAVVASCFATFLFGFLPAWQASRSDLAGTLKQGGRGSGGDVDGRRVRGALVLAEVALALVLLVGAGLLTKSFATLVGVEPGFDPDNIWAARLNLPDTLYDDEAQRIALYRRLVEQARALPGVESVGTVFPAPLSGNDWINTTYLEGEPLPTPNQERNVNVRFVSPGYFETLRIPLKRGRALEDTDDAEAQLVAVVNESAAKAFWPDENPIGKRFSFGRPTPDDVSWYTVVGVVGDVRHNSLDSAIEPAFYPSVYQNAPSSAELMVRTRTDPQAIAQPLRQLLQNLDADLPFANERTGNGMVANSVARPRFNMTLLAAFATLALLLATVGVFGMVNYAVTQRLREVGVRLALGARSGQIVSLILGQGMRPVLGGIVLGLAGAFACARLLRSLVYGISTTDPATYAVVGTLLAAVAALACLAPALRTLRVDPVRVLRDE